MNELEKTLINHILNSNYGLESNKNYVDTDSVNFTNNVNFNDIIRDMRDIKRFLNNHCDFTNYHYITHYIMMLEETIIILAKLKACDETSATKCFTCINDIKDLINRSNLL